MAAPGGGEDLGGLMARVASGDRLAFRALFERAAPKVKAYLQRLGSVPAAAEDLTQDVFLTVWRRAASFDPAKAGVMTWIFVIARNRRIDSLRREASTVTYGIAPPADDGEDEEPSAHDHAAAGEEERRLRRAVAQLPPEQLAVITASYWQEDAHGAIAEALGIPLGTVKSRLRLALTRLRAAIGEQA